MKDIIIRFLFILLPFLGFSQSNPSWGGYFSYNNVIGISQSDSHVFASTENAFFSKHLSTDEVTTFNSVDGLKSEKITAFYHSKQYNLTFLGNENGLLIIVNQNNKKVINKVDIINDVPVPNNIKRINHFTEHSGNIYISTDYGISVLKLNNLEFGDTYYISENGTETRVLQTTILDNEIYAATQNYGIRKASLSNPFLINYNAWETHIGGNWVGITSTNGHLLGCNWNTVYRILPNGTTISILNTSQNIIEIKTSGAYTTVTTPNIVYILNEQLSVVTQIGQFFEQALTYNCAEVINSSIYVGTSKNGMFSFNLNTPNVYQNYIPSGPLRNKVYSIKATSDNIWCVFGESVNYDPYNPEVGRYGISKLTTEGWKHIPYEDLLNAASLSDIAIFPNNENIVYIGSNYNGLLKLENDTPIYRYDQTNTGQNGLEGFNGGTSSPEPRVHNLAFDRNNNLWMTNAGFGKGLKVLKTDNSWASYQVVNSVTSYGDILVDKNETKWLATRDKGVIGFNENFQNRKIEINTSYDNGLPYIHVHSIAVDKNNRLWIGTTWGLRVLSSVDKFITEDQPSVNPIIIMDDGLAQELMYRQPVSKIKVDGADRKWLGTLGAGVFLVSSNGQETIHHFTKDNSPLPSNNILDIDINPKTGEVFFATDKGMVSYKGTATAPSGNLSGVYVYPNPVRPEFAGTVKIAGLTDAANVKITDIEGNLVHEAKSEGGTIEWDTTAFGKYRVASGVYMIFITAKDGEETKVKKVMIIR